MKPETYTYNYKTLMRLTGKSRKTVYQDRTRGYFNPDELETVVVYLARHGTLDLRHRMFMNMFARELSEGPGKKGARSQGARRKTTRARKKEN